MVTIKQIAKLAGVSPTTVSNVLHERNGKVSEKNLKRIQQVIAETHYVPNMGGRLLAKHGSRIIGVIMFYEHRKEINAMHSPFYGELIGTLESEIRQSGYFMLFYTVKNYEESIRVVSGWDVEGLIVLHSPPSEISNFINNLPIPVVFIDSYLYEKSETFHNVGLDDFEGGRQMGEFLLQNGLSKTVFLADEKKLLGVDKERLNGLKTVNLEIKFVPISHLDEKRHAQIKDFVKNEIKNYQALFFASDFYAVDSMNLIQDLGVRVPDDISVAGFDDNILAQESRPRLTTMRQKVSDKGKLAVEMMMRRIHGEEIEVKNQILPVELVVRDSVKIRK